MPARPPLAVLPEADSDPFLDHLRSPKSSHSLLFNPVASQRRQPGSLRGSSLEDTGLSDLRMVASNMLTPLVSTASSIGTMPTKEALAAGQI